MKQSISEYVGSEEFRKKMKNVSAKSRPFGNSTPSEKVYDALAQAVRRRKSNISEK